MNSLCRDRMHRLVIKVSNAVISTSKVLRDWLLNGLTPPHTPTPKDIITWGGKSGPDVKVVTPWMAICKCINQHIVHLKLTSCSMSITSQGLFIYFFDRQEIDLLRQEACKRGKQQTRRLSQVLRKVSWGISEVSVMDIVLNCFWIGQSI